jgi:glycosyltransferase involved in cell wall biosynthesis
LTAFSIITPSYNQGRYLAATIESVLDQAGDFTIDYVICDGGSKDDSVAIIKRYEAERRPLKCRGITYRWLSEKDRGQTDAIRKGFAMATGDVLAWLNSDDTYLPGTLATVAREIAGKDFVYGKSQFIDEHGTVIGKYPTEPFDANRLAAFNFIAQPSTFFRRAALEAVGGPEANLHYVMDYDLWIRLSRQFALHYVPEFLSTFRLHDESKTVSPAHALANQKETLDAVVKYYGWAPLNRVYAYARELVRTKTSLGDRSAALLSMPVAAAQYVRLNRGVRVADLRMLNPTNLRKVFMKPTELSKLY